MKTLSIHIDIEDISKEKLINSLYKMINEAIKFQEPFSNMRCTNDSIAIFDETGYPRIEYEIWNSLE